MKLIYYICRLIVVSAWRSLRVPRIPFSAHCRVLFQSFFLCILDSSCKAFSFYDGTGNPFQWSCYLFRSDKEELECEGCWSGKSGDNCSCGSPSLQCVDVSVAYLMLFII